MTRVNIGVAPHELSDCHLLAEYRELPRIRGVGIKRLEKASVAKVCASLPTTFRLNAGHVLCLLDKGQGLEQRWQALKDEMIYRGYSPTLEWQSFAAGLCRGISDAFAAHARPIVMERLIERITAKPHLHKWTNREKPTWIESVLT